MINKKENASLVINNNYKYELPEYTELDERITNSLASQAAIFIERTRLQAGLPNLVDSMIMTLSTVLDQRRSNDVRALKRVASLSLRFVKVINESNKIYKGTHFNDNTLKELNIASLINDVEKIGVPERLL